MGGENAADGDELQWLAVLTTERRTRFPLRIEGSDHPLISLPNIAPAVSEAMNLITTISHTVTELEMDPRASLGGSFRNLCSWSGKERRFWAKQSFGEGL